VDLPWDELPVPVLLLDPGEGANPLREVMSEERPRALTMMIGPEGGWSGEERDLLQARRARAVSLGPRVLRTETAALVAVSIAMHRWGDLG
jgi:16S rRNA (uracil1498-N3)-methyltransferase